MASAIGVLGLTLVIALRILVPQDFGDTRDEHIWYPQLAPAR